MSYLLDTNVVSEVRKPVRNAGVEQWFSGTRAEDFFSVLVAGEVRRGVERLRRRDPAQAAVYEAWLATLHRDYADRMLPITAEVADMWGRLNAIDPLPVVDGLIAATALVQGLTLLM